MTPAVARRSVLLSQIISALVLMGPPAPVSAQKAPPAAQSAPLRNLRYEITFDSTTAATRTLKVAMSFDVAGPGPVL
ncbi:MAG: hypothetical protein ABJC36_05830, partial [Gemmatimonadales bacterium]